MSSKQHPPKRSGFVAVFALCLMVVMLAFIALAVDVGYLSCVDSELQRTADAAAIAATSKLVEEEQVGSTVNSNVLTDVANTAGQFAALNSVANSTVTLSSSDVSAGQLSYPFSSCSTMSYANPSQFNAVTVRIRKTSDAGESGQVPLFFARIMGFSGCNMERDATAAFLNNVGGFQTPSNGQNLQILPFALDQPTWKNMLAGAGTDNYSWDPVNKCVTSGSDGILEVNLYPQGTGSPGNRGTVNIGPSNNSTAHLCSQILYGVTQDDLNAIGGSLQFDQYGNIYLNGDTGISAGMKDALGSIVGQTRIIPVFDSVTGPGNNAEYTVVQLVGVRIMNVKLTGSPSSKQVIVQPASVISCGAIPPTITNATSQFIYSPVWLVH